MSLIPAFVHRSPSVDCRRLQETPFDRIRRMNAVGFKAQADKRAIGSPTNPGSETDRWMYALNNERYYIP